MCQIQILRSFKKKGKKDINLLFLFPMILGSKSYKELKSKDQNIITILEAVIHLKKKMMRLTCDRFGKWSKAHFKLPPTQFVQL